MKIARDWLEEYDVFDVSTFAGQDERVIGVEAQSTCINILTPIDPHHHHQPANQEIMSSMALRIGRTRANWTPLRPAAAALRTQNPIRLLPFRCPTRPTELVADSIGAVSSVFAPRNASSSAMGGDLGNPQSTSSDQAQVKSSRATDGTSSPDTASLQTPVSDRSSIPGDQDEGTASHDKVKRDPNEPAEEKRKSVESQGKKPLGPEDHQ
ncbi:MAG: hypothetical protein Q9203_002497 [Teloschistes exilis]